MSSISNAGIFIDIKQLMKFTHIMKKEMSNIKEGVRLLDTITRKGIIKDYENLKIL